jgi:hypothetical protein
LVLEAYIIPHDLLPFFQGLLLFHLIKILIKLLDPPVYLIGTELIGQRLPQVQELETDDLVVHFYKVLFIIDVSAIEDEVSFYIGVVGDGVLPTALLCGRYKNDVRRIIP